MDRGLKIKSLFHQFFDKINNENKFSMNPENKKLMYDVAKDQLNQQIVAVDSFTTRAGLVLATCGVVFAGYLQLLGSQSWLQVFTSWLFIPEIILMLLSAFFAFLSLVPGGEKGHWRYDPEPEKLYKLIEENESNNKVDIQDEMVRSMIVSYKHNKDVFNLKFTYLKYSRYLLCASGAIFIIHLLIFFF